MATIDQTIRYNANQRERAFRSALRAEFGRGKFRITRPHLAGGEVHAYGKMPNSDVTGWWLVGDRRAVERSWEMGFGVRNPV